MQGPKSNAAGYFGTKPVSGIDRFYYQPDTTLTFTWVWTIPAGDPVPAGTELFVGLGGINTTSAFWINTVSIPTISGPASSSIHRTGSTAGGTSTGPGSNYEITAPIPAGSTVTFTGTVTLRHDVPQQVSQPNAFTANATARYAGDSQTCPAIKPGFTAAYEQNAGDTTPPACNYAIVSQAQLDRGHP